MKTEMNNLPITECPIRKSKRKTNYQKSSDLTTLDQINEFIIYHSMQYAVKSDVESSIIV